MRLPAPSLPDKKALRDMVGLIIPDNTRPAISWQGCSLGIWGGVSGSISIAHMPKHIFRGPGSVCYQCLGLEITLQDSCDGNCEADEEKTKEEVRFHRLALLLKTTFNYDGYVSSDFYFVYVDMLVFGSFVLCILHIIHSICYIYIYMYTHIYIYIYIKFYLHNIYHTYEYLYVLNLSPR